MRNPQVDYPQEYLAGYWLGDGYGTKNGSAPRVMLEGYGTKDRERVQTALTLQGVDLNFLPYKGNPERWLHTIPVDSHHILRDLGMELIQVSKTKKMSDKMLLWPAGARLAALISGMWDADGTVNRSPPRPKVRTGRWEISYKTASQHLASHLKTSLIKFDIDPGLNTYVNATGTLMTKVFLRHAGFASFMENFSLQPPKQEILDQEFGVFLL